MIACILRICFVREHLETVVRACAQQRKDEGASKMPPPAGPINSNGKRTALPLEDGTSLRHGDVRQFCDVAPRTPSRTRADCEMAVSSPRGQIASPGGNSLATSVSHHMHSLEESALGQQVLADTHKLSVLALLAFLFITPSSPSCIKFGLNSFLL